MLAMFAGPSIKLFKLLGFRISAHWTLALALALAGFRFGGLGGVALALLLFVSVLLHELGHALVARHFRVPVIEIELHMFGGVTKLATLPRSAIHEIWIAAAGPAVTLLIGAVALVAHIFVPSELLLWLGAANVVLGVLNLLPAFPLDGGRVLRAFFAKRRGLYVGTLKAVKVSRVLILLVGVGAVFANDVMLVLIAVMLWLSGTAELRNVGRHS